ncbi:MAG: hypothetical protein HY830_00660 [Actinobacteria bacterium]|nr:hypothetical protein [Actinomycetota bacterium]
MSAIQVVVGGFADACPLPVGQHADRAEPQGRLVVRAGACADDVPDDQAVLDRDERQRRDPCRIAAQPRQQGRLTGIAARLCRRGAVRRAAERGSGDGTDGRDVVRSLSPDQHAGRVVFLHVAEEISNKRSTPSG